MSCSQCGSTLTGEYTEEEGNEREPKAVKVESKEGDCEQGDRYHPDREPNEAHDHQRDDELHGAQRSDHHVAQIARPHFLQERNGEAELAAKQDIPHEHGGDEDSARPREESGILRKVELQESPHEQLNGRPVDQFQEARPGRAQEIEIAQDHRRDTMRRQCYCVCVRKDHSSNGLLCCLARWSAPTCNVEKDLLERIPAR